MNALNLIVIGATSTFGAAGAAWLAHHGEAVQMRAIFEQTVSGQVTSVDLDNAVFGLKTEDGTTKEVTVTSETVYTVDGEDATAEEVLEEGAAVTATLNELGEASAVERDAG